MSKNQAIYAKEKKKLIDTWLNLLLHKDLFLTQIYVIKKSKIGIEWKIKQFIQKKEKSN